jgi:Uma2 family endonuclease
MNLNATFTTPAPIVYPESDGQPMADNTKQLRWIVILFDNLAALFHDRSDVFVAANLFWYPVEGHLDLRIAPDVLVVFGRPKGDRGSYKQWEEANIPVTVAFEVLSPSNSVMEMDDKQAFCEDHGAEEYYVYDPDSNRLKVFVRRGDVLRRVRGSQIFTSPRMGIRFDLSGSEMVVYGPKGDRFLSFEELKYAQVQVEQRFVRLAELSRKARQGQASAEELQELERLEVQAASTSPGTAGPKQ